MIVGGYKFVKIALKKLEGYALRYGNRYNMLAKYGEIL
jgi:hypothetical protein